MITITVGTNSFLSLEDADTYFETRLGSDVWESTDTEDKKKALVSATKKLNNYSYIGQMQSSVQSLAWPRYVESSTNVRPFNNYISQQNFLVDTPQDIKDATCEEALALLSYGTSKHIRNQKLGIKSMSMGSESISYTNMTSTNDVLSSEADSLIQKWIKKGYNFGTC